MDNESEIEKIIQKKGGRLDYSGLDENLKRGFELVKFRAEGAIEVFATQLVGINNIFFDIIDDYSFNAFATGINNTYFIGINRGTIATLSLIFDRMLADNEIFSYIGNTELEKKELPLLENISTNFEYIVNMVPPFSPPQCPVRRAVSKRMTELALDFILAHEITHIINGHVAFGAYKLDMAMDEMATFKEEETRKMMINKTLEMDADALATTILLTSELNICLGKAPLPGNEWLDIYKNPGIVLMQFSFVISTIFKIFGDQRLNNSTFETDAYPKPRLRLVISMLEIKSNPEFLLINERANFNLDENEIPITIEAGFKIIEAAFERITGKKSNTLSIDDARGQLGFNQINKMVDFWNSDLKNTLQKYAHKWVFEKESV